MVTYEFGIKTNKEIGYEAIVLQDKTHIVLGKQTMSFMFPKEKFTKIFQQQIKDKTKSFIGVTFDMNEINAISKGLSMLGEKDEQR